MKTTKNFIRFPILNTCFDCRYIKHTGNGSIQQQDTICSKIEPNFPVEIESTCDEYEDR